ncbi:metal ABC transporter ATP-binding protein [Aquihabitans sp. McL0605]|uniref:metal ABC transporter ATP-binding protein n=1 Tax=Aquihabitans sp. McL0605 TaxID=3415671 RepID=UPI003CF0EEFA
MPVTDDAATAAVVEFRGCDIGYEGRAVVNGLDLTIRSGEVLGVLGANGSGKSTMIRGLLGLAPLLAGDIRLFGTPRSQFHAWNRLGYVPQRQTVAGGIPSTVAEVVGSGRLSALRPWKRFGPADRIAVDEAIEAVGLGGHEKHSMTELSGGQQRRVLIARALATGPDLLVLDEPTAGVDHANQEALAHALARLVERGTTIVLITHELGPVEPLITRAIVLRDGLVVHDGPPLDHEFHHEHDDEWHHHHGEPPTRRPGLGLGLD